MLIEWTSEEIKDCGKIHLDFVVQPDSLPFSGIVLPYDRRPGMIPFPIFYYEIQGSDQKKTEDKF